MFAEFCLALFIYFLVVNEVISAIMSFMFGFFIPLIYAVEKWLKLKFPAPTLAITLFIAMGIIMGVGYNLYTLVPFFDIILHVLSGFVFACLGFGLFQLAVGEAKNKKAFWACLLFGFALSLAIGLVWELFEYLGTALFGLDMQEDTIVNGFNSYLLSGTHSETFNIDGITQTVIYFGSGKSVTIDGYLDIGLIDTIEDMAVCFLGAIIYFVAIAIDWHKKKILFRGLIPQLVNNAVDAPPIISNEISDDVLEVAAEIDGELKLTVCSDLCDVANND